MINQTIAHYKITDKLGQGGMGEVYRATDTKLDRDVAIKILPESFAGDRDRIARFKREAKVLAALNHPNIAAIYGIEQAGDTHALVMELIEGETLGERLEREPMTVTEALDCCKQIAEALEAAHEKGIIHRDLKPENVKIDEDGRVKVLDFGLAKEVPVSPSSANQDDSPTITHMTTVPGQLLGTAPYMSPEQARAKPVDKRSDIWSFGCVLYECLTGKAMFQGEDVTETLATIIKSEPDWTALPEDTPPTIELLLRKCLNKDRKRRLHDIADARIDLEQALGDPSSTMMRLSGQAIEASSSKQGIPGRMFLGCIVIASLLTGVLVWSLKPQALPRLPVRKFAIPVDGLPGSWSTRVKLSPNGQYITFVADNKIKVWRLRDLQVREVEFEHRAANGIVSLPLIWSSDSRYIAYAHDSELWKVPVDVGEPVSICRLPGTGAVIDGSWGRDGRIAFNAWRGDMFSVSADGGTPQSILSVAELYAIDFHGLDHLPDGSLLPDVHPADPNLFEEFGSNLRRWVDGQSHVVLSGRSLEGPVYSNTGHILYNQGSKGRLFAVPYSVKHAKVTGDPFLVADDAYGPAVSQDGLLVYLRRREVIESQRQLVWLDRTGQVTGQIGEPASGIPAHALSSDERCIVVVKGQKDRSANLWILDLDRNTQRRLTFEDDDEELAYWSVAPSWSSNGNLVFFPRSRNLTNTLYAIRSDGSGVEQELFLGQNAQMSPDGRHLVYEVQPLDGGSDLWHCPLPESGRVTGESREET